MMTDTNDEFGKLLEISLREQTHMKRACVIADKMQSASKAWIESGSVKDCRTVADLYAVVLVQNESALKFYQLSEELIECFQDLRQDGIDSINVLKSEAE